jgi:hypothetical protein
MNRSKIPILAGVILIAIGCLRMLSAIAILFLMAIGVEIPDMLLFGIPGVRRMQLQTVAWMAAVLILLSGFVILSGLLAAHKKRWSVVAAGSAVAVLLSPLLGFIILILTIMAKGQFIENKI